MHTGNDNHGVVVEAVVQPVGKTMREEDAMGVAMNYRESLWMNLH